MTRDAPPPTPGRRRRGRRARPRLLVPRRGRSAAAEFPEGYEGYHTYAEIAAATKAVADAHPDIARRFSIGKSYQGREIWAMKISDNVATDEAEPEVLFDGGHHADEHMGVEMTLKIMHWLVDGYGTDPRITNIVNSREIWLVFSVNPDGAELRHRRRQIPLLAQEPPADARDRLHRHGPQPQLRLPLGRRRPDEHEPGGHHLPRHRRRSRRPRPARCATSWPAASSAAASRSGPHITFHESGRLVMWPYGYTTTDVPAT